MLEFFYKGDNLAIVNDNKKEINFFLQEKTVLLDGFDINFPGEYEKSEILLEVMEKQENLFYKFNAEKVRIVILTSDSFELNEENLSFFGDVDVLILPGTKNAVKIYENIEAKLVLPYGEEKDIFFNTLAQHKEAVKSYKLKGELAGDITEFVNLEK
ncbi:hypothetical protein HGA92_04665 [Candidatus Gracilibacteria bacterium]|nr:hypothetical protein [Candidatus Gracilibacteria bacterium]NUJ98473.1 hypothetical protein [Candidatus Gracilibacteria bacterium]